MIPSETRRASGKIHFAEFVVDLEAGEMHRGALKVPLQDKPLKVLEALTARPGKVVSREELRRLLWDENTFVDFDNNLNAAVKKLRDALGDSAETPRFVETVPRKGYRFIAETTAERKALVADPDSPHSEAPKRRNSPERRQGPARDASLFSRRTVLITAALALATLTGLGLLVLGSGAPRSPSARAMLLVLPFENLTEDPGEEYFSDGLTEDMITHLARLHPEELGVIARLSAMTYKGTTKTPAEIAREIGVDYILQGGVQRFGERVRITAQLLETEAARVLWADMYDLGQEDAFEVRNRVVARVADSLAVELLALDRSALARAGTLSAEAYRHYLRGRHRWHEFRTDSYLAAVEHFRNALEEDSEYAAAHAALADTYNLLAFTGHMVHTEAFARARQAAETALAIHDRLAEAHNALAFAQLYGEWDLPAARTSFERALELAPGYAMAYHWYSAVLSATGHHDAAIAAVERSLLLDPASLSVLSDLGWYYLYADRYEEAAEICRQTLERRPEYGWARDGLLQALFKLEQHEEARALALKIHADQDEEYLAALRLPDPALAMRSATRLGLERQLAGSVEAAEALGLAQQLAILGERDEAFHWLEQAFLHREPWLVFLEVDPMLDALHDDPRFTDLARRIGLRPAGP